MKKFVFVLIVLGLLGFSVAQEGEGADSNLFTQQDVPAEAADILANLDANTNFSSDISTLATVEQSDPERDATVFVYRFFRRDSDDKFLLLIEKPESQLGTGYLRIDNGLWTYDPESRQFSYQSEDERIGDTDTDSSDYSAFGYSKDYDILSAEEGTLGKFDVWIFALQGKNNEVSPPFVRLWVSKEPNVLLKEEDYSLSQRLTYTTYYPKYATIEGRFIPEQQIGVDNLVEGRSFRLQLEDISLAAIPDNIFTKAYVERVNR